MATFNETQTQQAIQQHNEGRELASIIIRLKGDKEDYQNIYNKIKTQKVNYD